MRILVPAIVLGLLAGLCGPVSADGFSYLDFAAPTRLIFQADALPTNGVCRLTPSSLAKVGGVWFEKRMRVHAGFETTFQIQITDPRTYGADGMAFVMQHNQTPSLGERAWKMGFGGISNSLVVKFDNYHWKDKVYQKYDEIAVSVCGTSGNCDPDTNAVASVCRDMLFADGRIHTVRMTYVSGDLSVYVDDFRKPVLKTPLSLPEAFETDRRGAWVGFTAGTGMDYQTHDVVSWTFYSGSAEIVSPGTVAQGGRPRAAVASPPALETASPATPPAAAVGKPASGTQGVPAGTRGPVMLTLPVGKALPWTIEASTNLVNWEPVTNVMVYFSEPESTNFNARFYRIFEEQGTPR